MTLLWAGQEAYKLLALPHTSSWTPELAPYLSLEESGTAATLPGLQLVMPASMLGPASPALRRSWQQGWHKAGRSSRQARTRPP